MQYLLFMLLTVRMDCDIFNRMVFIIGFISKKMTALLHIVIDFESFTNLSEAPVVLAHRHALWTNDEPALFHLFFPYNSFQDIVKDFDKTRHFAALGAGLQVDTDTLK